MHKFYQNKVSNIESKLVNQQKLTEQAKEEIKFHKNQTKETERQMRIVLEENKISHEETVSQLKKEHMYELSAMNERARNRREVLLVKIVDQRKNLHKKFEAQKREILHGFKRAIEATHKTHAVYNSNNVIKDLHLDPEVGKEFGAIR